MGAKLSQGYHLSRVLDWGASIVFVGKSETEFAPMGRDIENWLIAAVLLGSIFAAIAFVMGGVYNAFLFVAAFAGPISLLLVVPIMESKPPFPGVRLAAIVVILLMAVGGLWCGFTLATMDTRGMH